MRPVRPLTYAMSKSRSSTYSRPIVVTARDKGMDGPIWTCLGEGAEHPVELAHVELLLDRGGTEISVQRCRACGQLYRFERFELNDWSGGGDYCDRTSIWKALEPDEVETVRGDLNYQPRGGRQHRFDTGWKREGS